MAYQVDKSESHIAGKVINEGFIMNKLGICAHHQGSPVPQSIEEVQDSYFLLSTFSL